MNIYEESYGLHPWTPQMLVVESGEKDVRIGCGEICEGSKKWRKEDLCCKAFRINPQ